MDGPQFNHSPIDIQNLKKRFYLEGSIHNGHGWVESR